MSSEELPECNMRLDDSTSATLTLPDGRKLGYAEYGASTGQPIFYCHGFPGARIEATALDQAALKVNARIIAIDRPGNGWSSMHKDRTLLSYAQDVDSLANHLKLNRYGVLGVSGGGPYVLACARALPAEKMRAASIICGIGPPDMGYYGMRWLNYLGWTYGQRMLPTSVSRWFFSREPGAQLHLSDKDRLASMRNAFEKEKASMYPQDAKILGDTNFMLMRMRTLRESYAQGMDGMVLDFKVLNADFGFKIEDIRKDLPVQLWYGNLDTNVPLHHGKETAARLGDNAHLEVKDETHASIWANWREECLRALVKAMEE